MWEKFKGKVLFRFGTGLDKRGLKEICREVFWNVTNEPKEC